MFENKNDGLQDMIQKNIKLLWITFWRHKFKHYQFQKGQNDYDVSKVFQNNEKDGLLSLHNICKPSFKETTKAAKNLRDWQKIKTVMPNTVKRQEFTYSFFGEV